MISVVDLFTVFIFMEAFIHPVEQYIYVFCIFTFFTLFVFALLAQPEALSTIDKFWSTT